MADLNPLETTKKGTQPPTYHAEPPPLINLFNPDISGLLRKIFPQSLCFKPQIPIIIDSRQ